MMSFFIGHIIGLVLIFVFFTSFRLFFGLLFQSLRRKIRWKKCIDMKLGVLDFWLPSILENEPYVLINKTHTLYLNTNKKSITILKNETETAPPYVTMVSGRKIPLPTDSGRTFYSIESLMMKVNWPIYFIYLYLNMRLKSKKLETFYPQVFLDITKMTDKPKFDKITRKEKLKKIF